jgi:hypothetical protein
MALGGATAKSAESPRVKPAIPGPVGGPARNGSSTVLVALATVFTANKTASWR